jgi:UDP-N-acetyl-D-glucosamine dehydrogenase
MKYKKNTIAVQGFGYVGAVNAVNVALSKELSEYNVLCFEKKNKRTLDIIKNAEKGHFPYNTNDQTLIKNFKNLVKKKKINFTFDSKDYQKTKIIIITINYDLKNIKKNKYNFLNSFQEIINNARTNSLIILETTVPPGTTEYLLKPMLDKIKKKKNCNFYLSHAFERVTPGNNYLSSCKDTFRVYSGINKKSKKLCKDFLKKITNYKKYPLTELDNPTSSETCKIIENSYRAVNIAFIDEWMKFSKKLNINLHNIIDAIKKRSTHSNIMLPGLGVGGYCLTKDPLFGSLTSQLFFKKKLLKFPLSSLSVKINKDMTGNALELIIEKYSNSINNKKILFVGMSYKNDVGDLRNSPSIELANKLFKLKSKIYYFDPLVKDEIKNFIKVNDIKQEQKYDIILFCVKHRDFKNFSFINFNQMKKTIFFDLNNVVDLKLYNKLKKINKIYKLAFPC